MNLKGIGCHSAPGYALRSVSAVNTGQKSTLNNPFFCLDNPGHSTVPFDSGSELTVYDLSGRVVHSITGEYCTGVHEVLLEGLASGMYMVRMTSEEFTATQQFVMID